MRLFPCGTHTRAGEAEMQASGGVFRDVLADLELFLALRGIREGLTKMVTFDLRPQRMSPQVGRVQ